MEQAGFRRGRSTVDHVTLLTQDIEDSFSVKKRVGVVFIDLAAAYDTVCTAALDANCFTYFLTGTCPYDNAACPKQEFYPHYRLWKA